MRPHTRALGAVVIHTDEEALLAELLAHYGDDVSLVLDSTWMLILPERSELPDVGP